MVPSSTLLIDRDAHETEVRRDSLHCLPRSILRIGTPALPRERQADGRVSRRYTIRGVHGSSSATCLAAVSRPKQSRRMSPRRRSPTSQGLPRVRGCSARRGWRFQHGLGIGHGIDHVTIDFAGQDDVDAIGDVKLRPERCWRPERRIRPWRRSAGPHHPRA